VKPGDEDVLRARRGDVVQPPPLRLAEALLLLFELAPPLRARDRLPPVRQLLDDQEVSRRHLAAPVDDEIDRERPLLRRIDEKDHRRLEALDLMEVHETHRVLPRGIDVELLDLGDGGQEVLPLVGDRGECLSARRRLARERQREQERAAPRAGPLP
jgi:hypothetical protein